MVAILDDYDLAQYKEYLAVANDDTDLEFFELEGAEMPSYSQIMQMYRTNVINNNFDITKFVDRIDEIYSYAYVIDDSNENFHLIGKWDNGKYFYYRYHLNSYFYDPGGLEVRIILCKDYQQLVKAVDIDDQLIKVKSKKLS